MTQLMIIDVEIVLRDREAAVTEHILHTGNAVEHWTDTDVEAVLKAMLLAMDRVKNPESDSRHVALRGFSWIVEPTKEGVVIAIEIPIGAAVAGPFDIDQVRLDAMVRRVLAAASPTRPVVH